MAVGLFAATAAIGAHETGLLGSPERASVDARFSIRASQPSPANVAVVGIDNNSLGALPRYPFSRRLHARVLANLHAAGARLVVYDIAFDRPTAPDADAALFEAARRAAPVVFATSLISPSGETQVLGGTPNLKAIGDQAAAADLIPDSDGVLRHTLGEVNGLPTIAKAVALRLQAHLTSSKQFGHGWIDFAGPPGTVPRLSFVDVLRGHFDRAAVRGKVVVVGGTASVLQDLHNTAAGSPMSGPEVQANAIATALDGFPLHSPSGIVTVLLILALAFLVPVAGLRVGTLGACLASLLVVCLWSVATQLAFDSGVVLDYSGPLSALALATAGTVMLGIWADGRERRQLRMLFASGDQALVDGVLHATSKPALAATAIIAGYRLEEVLGRGGMAVVYRAQQLALDRTVAIKLIAAERAEDPMFRERFKSESRIAASIEHANVVPVYETGEDDGLLFIAMRLVDGVDLAQLLERDGALEPTRTVRIIEQIAGGLEAAHARNLVHRDVKPANVLLTLDEPEHAYLTDFGVAKQLGAIARVTKVGEWVGSIDYLPPEQIRGKAIGASADIYALTGVLYHCLTGEPPFVRESESAILWAHMSETPPAPSSLKPSLPEELDDVIACGMAKDPAERFPSAVELARACARAVGVPDVTLFSPSPRPHNDQLAAAPASPGPTRHSAP